MKWSASIRGKPNLPVWLHLFHSKHQAIAYLIGTPVTPLHQVTIHIIARRLDNYESAEQFLTILLNEDVRFDQSTLQIAEIRLKGVDAEEFMDSRNNKLKRLELAIHDTFRGKNVNPHIYNIISEMPNPLPGGLHFAGAIRPISYHCFRRIPQNCA